MPRKKRQFEVGKIYHIFNRGVDKRNIFLKPQDYSRFILGLEFFNSNKPINIYDLVGKIEKAVAGSDPATALDNTTTSSIIKERIKKEREKPRNPIIELMAFTLMPNH